MTSLVLVRWISTQGCGFRFVEPIFCVSPAR
jgi:hypothetical protein